MTESELVRGGPGGWGRAGRRWAIGACLGLLALGSGEVQGDDERAPADADDLVIVDCLLPAKVRRLGRRNTYLTPRQPVRTTAADCRIRGGEYTEPDAATYATSLRVWMPRAEAGDTEAQFYVAQIFEKGLGVVPDYASAAEWYRKAAEKGHAPSQVGLAYLYEEGLGVEADPVEALNWYRAAAGVAEGMVLLDESEFAALEEAREDLAREQEEADALRGELEELRRQLEEMGREGAESAERQERLQSLTERLEGQLAERDRAVSESRVRIASLEETLAAMRADGVEAPRLPTPAVDGIPRSELEFGRYFALVIGNGEYATLPPLGTATVDAREVAELLESKYGFEVELLLNATRYQIMSALNQLRERLTAEHNLLVYYAGHGRKEGDRAYWQPVDAEPGNPANWIPSDVVTEHLDLVPARHLFLVADSAYSGLRTRSAVARLPRGMTEEERYFHIRMLLDKRSRLVLSSGQEGPVPGGETGSRFSGALLKVLRDNDGVLEASRVYEGVSGELAGADAPPPAFAPMRWARNDVADFFFVPKGPS